MASDLPKKVKVKASAKAPESSTTPEEKELGSLIFRGSDPITTNSTTFNMDYEDYADKLRAYSTATASRTRRYISSPVFTNEEDEEYRLESPVQSVPKINKEMISTSVDLPTINVGKLFEEIKETNDFFPLFKFLVCNNTINEGTDIISRDWRGHYPNAEIARDAYNATALEIAKHIASALQHYCDYKPNKDDLEIIKTLLLDIYISSNPKLLSIETDSIEIISEIVTLSRERGMRVDTSLKEVNKVDFYEHRLNNATVVIVYNTLFNVIFVSNLNQYSTLRRSRLGQFYMLLRAIPAIKKDKNNYNEDMISINGSYYPRDLFEAITEINFDTFLSNLKLEYVLSKDIADDSVAGTKQLSLL